MKTKRLLAVLTAGLMVLTGMAGCSGSEKPAPASNSAAPSAESGEAAPQEQTANPTGKVVIYTSMNEIGRASCRERV